jgi:transposase
MVVYLNAKDTSSLCPICGEKLSPNGYKEDEVFKMRYGGG